MRTEIEIANALDDADLFLRDRATSAPAPLNDYDTDILLDIAQTCFEAASLIRVQKAQIENLKKSNHN